MACGPLTLIRYILTSHSPHLPSLQIGSVSVPEVPFVLSNRTTHPLNPQWASDGVLPLGLAQYISGDGAIRTVLDALGGKQEVSVFLGK